jgi:dephospho-CoA kinase
VIRVGLTGGIGSGKSTVARVFEVLGIPVYYADEATRQLMNTDEALKKEIISNFGEESYSNGQLNRPFIASIVFSNKEKLDLLNALTHPATIRHANEWMQQQIAPYVIKEAALIFESGSAENLDYVIGVSAPKPLRIRRVMERDGISSEEVQKRMSRQLSEDMKMKLCDFVLVNNELELLTPQVLALHEQLLKK